MRKLTNEIVDQRLLDDNRLIQRLDSYLGAEEYIRWKCLKCSNIWLMRASNVINNGSGCPACHTTSKMTNEKIDARLENRPIKRIEDIGPNNSNYKLQFQCKIELCQHIWRAKLSQVISDHQSGCPRCVSFSQRLTNEEFDAKCKSSKFTRIDPYITAQIYIRVLCDDCCNVWSILPANFRPSVGCPYCSRKNEWIMMSKLSKDFIPAHNIRLNEIDRSFKGRHSFDAYIIGAKNVALEYNGAQHYGPITFGKISKERAIQNFAGQVERDRIKKDFCTSRGIHLIEIDGREFFDAKLSSLMDDEIIPLIHKLRKYD